VTFRSIVEASALAHMHHHQEHPEGVPVWFGGRLNAAVVERVRTLDARLAASFQAALRSAGMTRGAPDFLAELLVRLFDRMFEFVFMAERTPPEQEAIVLAYVDMVATYMERFTTPLGVEGMSPEEFVGRLQPATPPASGAPTESATDGVTPKHGRAATEGSAPRARKRSASSRSRLDRKRT
jgi:hypothetical protein